MGTSKGFPLPTTGNWPHTKADVTLWASGGGTGSTGTGAVFDSYVAAYGGAQQAASRMQSSTRAGVQLGGFYQGVATGGLRQALEDTGLSELVGRPAREVMQGLARLFLDADNSLLDDAIVYEAYLDYRDEISELAVSFDDLSQWLAGQLDRAGVEGLVRQFFAHCVYRQFLRDCAERINKAAGTLQAAKRMYRQAKEYIFDKLEILARERASGPMNWTGETGNKVAHSILSSLFRILGV